MIWMMSFINGPVPVNPLTLVKPSVELVFVGVNMSTPHKLTELTLPLFLFICHRALPLINSIKPSWVIQALKTFPVHIELNALNLTMHWNTFTETILPKSGENLQRTISLLNTLIYFELIYLMKPTEKRLKASLYFFTHQISTNKKILPNSTPFSRALFLGDLALD